MGVTKQSAVNQKVKHNQLLNMDVVYKKILTVCKSVCVQFQIVFVALSEVSDGQ